MCNDPMGAEEQEDVSLTSTESFESVLDNACSRLQDRKIRYSLRRIRELEEILEKTEQELDEILLWEGRTGSGSPVLPK
ncbi:MAG: hypothetical protein LBD96_10925 [Treponema sp.]|nr:hypothetical protein [Treponema sp.]